jgi:dTDP-glucose pyrophosphorylase
MLGKVLVKPDTSLQEAMGFIDLLGTQGVVVVDDEQMLLGTLTDGDIRRSLLAGVSLNESVLEICNKKPIVATQQMSNVEKTSLMSAFLLNILPVVSSSGKVIDVELSRENSSVLNQSTPVLILAGGRGKRLGEITQKIPKPLVPIGGRPLLEILILRLKNQGFTEIYISIHYLAHEIIQTIGDGEAFGVKIQYLIEESPLGTAGSVSLLPDFPGQDSILVVNADLLHSLDFRELLYFHDRQDCDFTIVTAVHHTYIPFGVVHEENGVVTKIEEKPTRLEQVNAGIYAVRSSLIKQVQKNSALEMNDFIQFLIDSKKNVKAFHLGGFWEDIGDPATLDKFS